MWDDETTRTHCNPSSTHFERHWIPCFVWTAPFNDNLVGLHVLVPTPECSALLSDGGARGILPCRNYRPTAGLLLCQGPQEERHFGTSRYESYAARPSGLEFPSDPARAKITSLVEVACALTMYGE